MRRWMLAAGLVAALCLGLSAAPGQADADDQTDVLLEQALEPWTGDLEGIAARGFLRIGVPHNPLFIAYDGEKTVGLAEESGRELEKHLKEVHGLDIRMMLITLPRDEMFPALVEGRVDLLWANLTITADRAAEVAFTDPVRGDVREILVSGPGAGDIASLDDLAEVGLHLRPASSYFVHVAALNETRDAPIPVTEVDGILEDRDLLEMVNAGLIPAIIVDDHKARLWAQVFEDITLHEEIAVNEGGEIGWAVRQDAPDLLAALNGFVAKVKTGTLLGNILDKRYVQSADWLEKVPAEGEDSRYAEVLPFVMEHAEAYGLDWRMIIAQGYQESRLDQSKRSHAGAVGIMQLLPSTAKDPNVGIPDIQDAAANVEAGVKYLRFLKDRYFSEPGIAPLDRVLFALAAYNAGPGNIRKARARAEKMGFDPDVWFENVEIATAKAVSREPVIYVRNIYRYAVYFRLREEARAKAAAAREAVAKE